MTKRRTGAHLLLELLRSEGVEFVFGNPGTTELPLIDALVDFPDIKYIWGLQEASVVGMADGYAQASGKTGFVNLHTAGGVGHGMGGLINAAASAVPLVVTAGQQDLRHKLTDPLLFDDLEAIASPISKWSDELSDVSQLPILLRRAFQDAIASPNGPVFLSLPMDIMEKATDVAIPSLSNVDRKPIAGSLDVLADKLSNYEIGRVAIIAGDEIAFDDAMQEAVKLSNILGAPVYGSSWPGRLPFPTKHHNWQGNLPTTAAGIGAIMSNYDAIIALGGKSFISILYSEGPALPETCDLFQLSNDGRDLGRTYPTELSLVGDIKRSLVLLNEELTKKMSPYKDLLIKEKAKAVAANEAKQKILLDEVAELRSNSVIHPMVAAYEIIKAIPQDMPIVDEAIATLNHIRSFIDVKSPNQYLANRGGGLGWGIPASVGYSLACDRRAVVSLNGDGATMYSPQAMWTAAHENLPITFVVVNNREYNVLKNFMMSKKDYSSTRSNHFIAMDLDDPAIDFSALAASMGLAYELVEDVEDIAHALSSSATCQSPRLVEIIISAER